MKIRKGQKYLVQGYEVIVIRKSQLITEVTGEPSYEVEILKTVKSNYPPVGTKIILPEKLLTKRG